MNFRLSSRTFPARVIQQTKCLKFSLQPNLTTRERQLDAWASLVIDYCQHNKIYTAELADLQNSVLFVNDSISRQLSLDGIQAVFEVLERRSAISHCHTKGIFSSTEHIEWLDRQQTRCHIYWRRPEEWAKLIYDWVVSNGLLNTVCSLYELTHGDDTSDERERSLFVSSHSFFLTAFYGLDKEVLLKALQHLQSQGKAELITSGGSEGVKFFQ